MAYGTATPIPRKREAVRRRALRIQQPRAAAIAQLARATGMRLREPILADLPRLQREAEELGRINIQDGTKGGRSVDEHVCDALAFALKVSPDGSRNLLTANESHLDFQQVIVRPLYTHNL